MTGTGEIMIEVATQAGKGFGKRGIGRGDLRLLKRDR